MKTFDVFKHPVQGHEAVTRGFSWPAFFFTWIWAFLKQLWGMGLAFIGIMLVLTVAESGLEQKGSTGGVLIMLLLEIGACIWFGQKGNEWRSRSLKQRGFEHIQTLQAATPDAAVAAVSGPDAGDSANG